MKITFDEFIKKWTGKHIDFDGIYPNQCMDLMHQYVYEVRDLKDATLLAAPVARQVFTNFKPAWAKFFKKVPNTPTGVPPKGAIIFWKGIFINGVETPGHVAIVTKATVKDFYSFDANYPTGSLPKIVYHTWDNVLGWLEPIDTPSVDPTIELKAQIAKLQSKIDNIKKIVND